MLQSVDRGNLSVDQFTGNFRVELDQRAEQPVNVVQVVVGPTGFVGASEQAVVDYIRSTFVDRPKPDLIVTIAGPAAVFARKYRQQLFPDTPLLFASVDQRYLGDAPLGENETAVAVVNDFPRVIDDILQLLPQTRQVFMVTGSGQIGQFWHRELEDAVQAISRPADICLVRRSVPSGDPAPLCEPARQLGDLLCDVRHGRGGGRVCGRASVRRPSRRGQCAPVCGAERVPRRRNRRRIADVHRRSQSPHGRRGRSTVERRGRREASTCRRSSPGQPIFDWRELQRWGIPESRLPPGSVVRYRAPSLWQAYRGTVLSAVGVLAVQSLLIVGLLYQRRARRRAEIDSRRNLALAADASRRQTMSALTSSIAHELGQPLSSMIHNAQAGRMMITADRATPDTIGEILSDIESEGVQATQIIDRHRTMLRSHQLDKKPIDLHAVIHESLALVAHDMRARQIEATVNLSSNPCIITGDQVLLQQVLVNLVMNAMDAMAETPPARRRVTISTEVRAADVEVSVRDTGTGLPAQINGTLFTPFVTTKAHGLGIGLTIARTIVDAHGGTIDAHNNPEGGATFTVTLRRSETPKILSGPPSAA